MTHAGHRAYKKVDQRNRPCDLSGKCHLMGNIQVLMLRTKWSIAMMILTQYLKVIQVHIGI